MIFSHLGVRVFVIDDKNRLLLVKHTLKNGEFWILPGGGVEEDEYSSDAAIREVKEETNLDTEVINMLFNVEEKTEDGLRSTNYFLSRILSGKAELGKDPEFDDEHQVLSDIKFFTLDEIEKLENIFPQIIKEKFEFILNNIPKYDVFYKRPSALFHGILKKK